MGCLKYGATLPHALHPPLNNRYTHSLVETMLEATIESSENSSMFPIIDVLDEVRFRSPGYTQLTHRRVFRCPRPRPQIHF